MPTKTTTPTEAHEQAVKAIAAWTAELERARDELTRQEAAPVTDTAAGRKQAADLATAREYSYRCARALDDAIDRRDECARAVVTAEAEAMQPEIDKARTELAEHDKRTKELLAPLEKFTGRKWKQVDPAGAWRAAGGDGRAVFTASVRDRRAGALRALERRQKALRVAAQGGDPTSLCDPSELSPSLQVGGVLPSPSLVARQAQADEQAAAQAEHDAQVAQAQTKVDAALAALDVDLSVTADAPESAWADERGRRWREKFGATMTPHQNRVMWDDVNGHAERMNLLAEVAALAGWENANRVASVVVPAKSAAVTESPSGE